MIVKTIFAGLFLMISFSDVFAQLRVSVDEIDSSQKYQKIDIRLTPEMFFSDDEIVFQKKFMVQSDTPHRNLIDLENKTTTFMLNFGVGILRNRLNFDFHGAGNFPLSVTDYNNAIRRQIFDAEPTSQQRRNSLFPFN